jgi:hypothetical protein
MNERAKRVVVAAGLAASVFSGVCGVVWAGGVPVAEPPPGTPTSTPAEQPRAYAPSNERAPELTVEQSDLVAYQKHVFTLANPFFEGRAPGTRGDVLTADYFEYHFRDLGLEPAFTDGGKATFRQEFQFATRTGVTSSSVAFAPAGGAGPTTLAAGTDYSVLGFSASGTVTGPVVFVGYAIEKGGKDESYSTFSGGEDLSGKIALVMRFEPMDDQGKSLWSDGGPTGWSNAASITPKLRLVASKNPAAIVVVSPPGADDPRVATLETTQGSTRWLPSAKVPGVMLSVAAAEKLVAASGAGVSLMDLRKKADAGGGITELGGVNVTIAAEVERTPRKTWNIGGVLRGKGALAEEFVVVGGHHDHLGSNELGGSRTGEAKLHPGADDNASGSAGVLLAARQLSAKYRGLGEGASARSILFLTFGAEEIGLIGARAFVDNPPFETSRIVAMLNMDMIGRLREGKLELSGTGTAKGFEEFLDPMLSGSGLTVSKMPGGRGPSDHAVFYGANIPVLHFFTGLHNEYHKPIDTLDTLNIPGAARVVGLVSEVAYAIATRGERLEFTSTDRGNRATGPGAGTGMGGVRVRFGISPASYSDGKPGVGVGEVFPNTSAAEAGIKAGDRLISWNGGEVADVEDWMTYLGKAKPGDVVDVGIARGEEKLVVKVTLKARESGAR